MRSILAAVLLVVAASLVPVEPGRAAALAPAGPVDPIATGPLGPAMAEVLADSLGHGPGGVAALLVRDRVANHAAVGVRDSSGAPMSPTTRSRIGSVTKTFVATMVMQLVDEGRVGLDTPLREILPTAPVAADVTVRHLLSHRSGIASYTDSDAFVADVIADPARRFTPDEILAYVAAEIPSPAGRMFAYSNTNYILLGLAVEELDGTDLATSIRQRITDPLGLDSTRLDTGDDPAHVAAGWSPGFLHGETTEPYHALATAAWAAGGLVSTIDDLGVFFTALFDGRLMSETSLAAMTDLGAEGYGLGIAGGSDFALGADEPGFGHGGSTPGFQAFAAIQPDSGDMLVVLVNNEYIALGSVTHQLLGVGADG